MLGLVANSILLHGLTGVKATVALASWVGCELVGKLRGTAYPLIVRRENGSFATVTVVRLCMPALPLMMCFKQVMCHSIAAMAKGSADHISWR